ncbi:L-proline amide hydrolase [Kribbella voronezhensis]|uniref:L-proline amide hydrolase n=1 Tax=Kribbella voronezhensis TaxID=2512212 RepID=A0A4R7T7I8_9ACTN|nr:alpha/beta hydrolase [Kribbella voronezhensis]TDU87725.1 L-proline amide hydrolase [Kribbella voronezhensis]
MRSLVVPTRAALTVLLGGVLISGTAAGAVIGVAKISGSWAWPLAALGVVVAVPALAELARAFGRGRRARPLRGFCTSGVALALSVTWIWPHAEPIPQPVVPGTVFIDVGPGEKLAVHRTPASRPSQPPLIVVHGGPGVADMAHDVPAFARLAQDRDVYVYDQLGAGRSSRLRDPSGYTEQRAVADLQRVVAMTGAARVALLGHSWGARLVTRFAVMYPDQVAALVLSSPDAPSTSDNTGKLGDPSALMSVADRMRLYGQLLRPRNLFLYGLGTANPRLAREVAGDAELDARFAQIYARTRPGLLCDRTLTDRLGIAGVGHFMHNALAVSNGDPLPSPLPASVRNRLHAATLVIKPMCDYLPWAPVTKYAHWLPDVRVVLFPDAGHQAYNERPDAYADLVKAFLAARPLPIPAIPADTVPNTYRGVR